MSNTLLVNKLHTLSESLKVLAHPVRLKILLLIMRHRKQKLTVTEIQQKLELLQPETSRHLSILKSKNVLNRKKEGSNVFYFMNPENHELLCFMKYLNDK